MGPIVSGTMALKGGSTTTNFFHWQKSQMVINDGRKSSSSKKKLHSSSHQGSAHHHQFSSHNRYEEEADQEESGPPAQQHFQVMVPHLLIDQDASLMKRFGGQSHESQFVEKGQRSRKRRTAEADRGGAQHQTGESTKYSMKREDSWTSRNHGNRAGVSGGGTTGSRSMKPEGSRGSNERQQTQNRFNGSQIGSSGMGSTMNGFQGAIQGFGYSGTQGKYVSSYQKIQGKKALFFIENQAKQMNIVEEHDMLLGGMHMQLLPGDNLPLQSPLALKTTTNHRLDKLKQKQLSPPKNINKTDPDSILRGGIIISKIKTQIMVQAGISSSVENSHRSKNSQYKLGVKKSPPNHRLYQTTHSNHGGSGSHWAPKEASATPNLDLDYIIKHDGFTHTTSSDSKGMLSIGKISPRLPHGVSPIRNMTQASRQIITHTHSRDLEEPSALQGISLTNHIHDSHKRFRPPLMQGNLKYHVIRQILEKAKPGEVKHYLQQQRQTQNQTHISEDNVSSKEIPNQASLCQGESLLMAEDHHRASQGGSKLLEQTIVKVTTKDEEHIPKIPQRPVDIVQTSSYSLLIHQDAEKISFVRDEVNEQIQEYLSKQKNIKIRISSNSPERAIPKVSEEESASKRKIDHGKFASQSTSQPRKLTAGLIRGGGGVATTGLVSSHVTFYNQNPQQPVTVFQKLSNESLKLTQEQIQQKQWEETLCVHIRQLPIYSKDGSAIPLNRFASPNYLKSARNSHNAKHQLMKIQHYKSMNASKLKEGQQASSAFCDPLRRRDSKDQATTKNDQRGPDLKLKGSSSKVSGQGNLKQHILNGVGIDQHRKSVNQAYQSALKALTIQNFNTSGVALRTKTNESSFDESDLKGLGNKLSRQEPGELLTGLSQQRTIKVPHIEFQNDESFKRSSGTFNMLLLKRQDTSPPSVPFHVNQDHQRSSYVKQQPPHQTPLSQNLKQPDLCLNTITRSNIERRNSMKPVNMNNNSNNIKNHLSQKSLYPMRSNMDSTINQHDTVNHTSGDLLLQSSIRGNPAVLVVNDSTSGYFKNDGESVKIVDSAKMEANETGAEKPLHLASMEALQSPLVQHQVEQYEKEQRKGSILSPPHQVSIMQGNVIPEMDRFCLQEQPSSLRYKIGPLYQRQSEVAKSLQLGMTTSQLPNLNKKYLVSLQQQFFDMGESETERDMRYKATKERDQQAKEYTLRQEKEKQKRDTKQQALFNSFERLSAHMKQRNFLRQGTGFNTGKSRVVVDGTQDSLYASINDRFMAEDGSLQNWYMHSSQGENLHIGGFTKSTLIDQTSLSKEASSISPMTRGKVSNETTGGAQIISDSRFFDALRKQDMMPRDPSRQQQHVTKEKSETRLMRKTQKQMQYANLSTSARLKTKCLLGRITCPFEVIKNGIPIHVQQMQLTSILQVTSTEQVVQVPYLKQTCLVEYIKDQWPSVLNNQKTMKDYQYFCLYYPERSYYNLIVFGMEVPLSKCCRKLLIFQFCQGNNLRERMSSVDQQKITSSSVHGRIASDQSRLKVYCSDPECCSTPLIERGIESMAFIESILNTPNATSQSGLMGMNRLLLAQKKHQMHLRNLDSDSSLNLCEPGSVGIHMERDGAFYRNHSRDGINSVSLDEEEEDAVDDFDSQQYLKLVQS